MNIQIDNESASAISVSMAVSSVCDRLLTLPQIRVWYEDNFTKLKTNLKKVNFVYEDIKKHKLFPEFVADEKNDSEAIKLREKGNALFKQGKYVQALENYTRSIATAKTDEIQALAYANRSNCLNKLKMHKEVVADIDSAFACNYSGENKEKLLVRRREAEKLQKPGKPNHEPIPIIPESEKNPQIQSASNCIKIEDNKDMYGRHIVATRNIEIGEVISVEKAYACVLRNDYYIHCHECLQLCYNLIPCKSCTQAFYCSEDCLEKARNAYHKYECPILLSMSKLGLSWIHIALKVAILAREDYKNLSNWQFNKNDYYRSDRYKEIHNLSVVQKSAFDKELFVHTVSSAILFELLKTKTQLLVDVATENAFKEVLLLQIRVASCNGLNIYEYAPAPDGICYEGNDFAGGLYSFSSLYNHSCCRNLYRVCYGSTLVVRAINTIKKGQQCFINYGAHYDVTPLFVRQIMLSKDFGFLCTCRACKEDWEANVVTFHEAMGLSLGSREGVLLLDKMAVADVEFAKKFLPRFVARLKRCENKEPWGEVLTLKRMIGHCYETFGSKRRI